MATTTLPRFVIETDGVRSTITVDGVDISSHVQSVTLRHEAGDVPRATIEAVEHRGANWKGNIALQVIMRCPVCSKEFHCQHGEATK